MEKTSKKSSVKKHVVRKHPSRKNKVNATQKKQVNNNMNKPKKVQFNNEPKKEIKLHSNELNKELVLKTIVIVSYTLIISILIMGFVDTMFKTYSTATKNSEPYILSTNTIDKTMAVDLSIARLRFSNLKGDYFVYLNYGSSRNAASLEAGLRNLIKQYKLENKFYYINIDDLKDDNDAVKKVNDSLGLSETLISKLPTIYYVNSDGILRIENIITRQDDNKITVGDFQNLLDINNY